MWPPPVAVGPTRHFTGRSSAIHAVNTAIDRLGPHATVALCVGESGTGKSYAAALLHCVGPLRHLPLTWLRCGPDLEPAALPATLVTAGTGAYCLEEVAELTPRAQSVVVGGLDAGSRGGNSN